MSITPDGLQDLDLGVIEENRDAWERLARELDGLAEDVDKVRNKTISEEHFDGTAADVSRTELKLTANDFDQAQEQASGMANLLDTLIDELRTCKTELNRFINEIASLGFKVESHNGRTIISSPSNTPTNTFPEISTLHHNIIDVLNRAQEAQDNLQNALVDTVGTPDTWRPGPHQLDNDPEAQLESMLEAGASPESIHQWWEGLSQEHQDDLMDTNAGLLGSTDGIPSDIRDTANRTTLETDIDKLQNELDEIDQELGYNPDGEYRPDGLGDLYDEEKEDLWARRDAAQAELDDLQRLQDRIGSAPESLAGNNDGNAPMGGSEAPHYLLDYGVEGNGTAVVAVGNPDEADNTTVYVPGTGSDLSGVGGDINRAQDMWDDALDADPSADTAVIAWVDYDAPPELTDATDQSYAKEASDTLNQFMEGIDATHSEEGGAHTTLLGHSYGSTVVGQTAVDHDVNVDQIIGVGSPGKVADHAGDFGIGADNVWTTRATWDTIGPASWFEPLHGPSPTSDGFGANVFESDSMGQGVNGAHSGYWDDGNIARRTMALIMTGQGDQVDIS